MGRGPAYRCWVGVAKAGVGGRPGRAAAAVSPAGKLPCGARSRGPLRTRCAPCGRCAQTCAASQWGRVSPPIMTALGLQTPSPKAQSAGVVVLRRAFATPGLGVCRPNPEGRATPKPRAALHARYVPPAHRLACALPWALGWPGAVMIGGETRPWKRAARAAPDPALLTAPECPRTGPHTPHTARDRQ